MTKTSLLLKLPQPVYMCLYSCPHASGKAKRIIIISMLSVLLLSGCNPIMTETDTQQSSTPITSQPSFLPISVKNTSTIRSIHEWRFYTVNAITWALDSTLFAVAGAESDNGKFGIYAYNISNFEERWFQELRNVPFGMTINPNTHAVFVPLLGGSNFVLDTATGKILKQVDYNVTLPCRGGIKSDFLPNGKQVFILNTHYRKSH